jgi:hypothetical protein
MTNKLRGTLYAIRNSVPVRYLSIWIITGLVLGIVGAQHDWGRVMAWGGEEYTYTKTVPECAPLQCEIERRTLEVYNRDHDKYLEQSRLQAMTEINNELMAQVYDSPHLDIDERGKVR